MTHLWNSLATGHRVHGPNLKLLESMVKREADQAWASDDKIKFDLLNQLFELYTEPQTPFTPAIEASAALSNASMVADIQRVLHAQQQVAATAGAILQPGIIEDPRVADRGAPVIIRTPDGETPALDLPTGEQRSVHVQPPAPADHEELYRSLHRNYTNVALAATGSSSSSSSWNAEYAPGQRYSGPNQDPGKFFVPRETAKSSGDMIGIPHHPMGLERAKSRRLRTDSIDDQGHIVTTMKRIFVPASHKDEDERYRNAQRAANQETSQEARVLETKKSKYEKRRQNFYG
jgi:hypothetical protein